MTICKITGYACNCQPDEGALCNGADELRKACDAWRKKAEQYAQEVEQLKAERDQWKKRADELFFAESPPHPRAD